MFVFVAVAFADPWLDAAATQAADQLREAGPDADLLFGVGFDLPTDVADKGATDPRLAAERARGDWVLRHALRPALSLALGDDVPADLGGDREAGLVSPRLHLDGAAYLGPFALRLAPWLGLDDLSPIARFRGWAGVDTPAWTLGFGKQERWIGPGRRGNLLLSDNAEPPWMGNGAVEGRLPWKLAVLGRFRVELGAGWLDQPRTDVANPGLLLMDLRWSPVSVLEIGATRLSIFGGEGRPPVDLGQLLVPTEPHIYDDPDQELPDQNEQVSLDLRLTLPFRRWLGGPVRWVEGWWIYAGEDMIVREAGGLSYPALAGVANLYGGEVAVGPVVVSGEYAALMDDYFRWYSGHRVYHEGFTQDGRALGWFAGGDSETLYASIRTEAPRWRGRLWGESVRRVGVIEAQNDRVFTLATEERRLRLGLDFGWRLPRGGMLSGGYAADVVSGEEFVPGADAVHHRVWVGWQPFTTVGEGGRIAWSEAAP